MNELLAVLTDALHGAPLVALVAAGAFGIASVVLSPCHLAAVPLVVSVVRGRNPAAELARTTALRFGLGMLAALGVVGLATVAVGRIAGDTGLVGALAGGALLVWFGLDLLDLVHVPWLTASLRQAGGTAVGPAVVGFLFGASLGPCTFAFLAPALGAAILLAESQPILAAGIVVACSVGHVGVVVVAGAFGDVTATVLRSRGAARLVAGLRKATGVVLVLAGLSVLAG